jgi:uncharacterized protein
MTSLHPSFARRPVVIGMLHLPALPGAPLSRLRLNEITDRMLTDARALQQGGVDGLMIENFGDVPFFKSAVPPIVIAAITSVAQRVRDAVDLPLGINVLRNDGCSALSIAHAVGAAYIRVNVLSGARVTDQGTIEGISADLLRLRASLGAQDVKILADVDVKHSAALAPRAIEDELDDTIHRGLADAVIVSGAGTGKKTDLEKLATVKSRAGHTPVFVGSGVDLATAADLARIADGLIVGTSIKRDGKVNNPVDPSRVEQLVRAARG